MMRKILLFVLFGLAAMLGLELNLQAAPTTLTVISHPTGVRFEIPQDQMEWRVRIFNLAGRPLFDSQLTSRKVLEWIPTASSNSSFSSGVYLAAVLVKDAKGGLKYKLVKVVLSPRKAGSSITKYRLFPSQTQDGWTYYTTYEPTITGETATLMVLQRQASISSTQLELCIKEAAGMMAVTIGSSQNYFKFASQVTGTKIAVVKRTDIPTLTSWYYSCNNAGKVVGVIAKNTKVDVYWRSTEPPVTIKYAVLNALTNQPLSGATITVDQESKATDPTGEASFTRTKGYSYTTTVSHPEYQPATVTSQWDQDKTVPVNLQPTPVTIIYTVLNAVTNQAVSGATVTVDQESKMTDASGKVSFAKARGSSYTVTVSHPDYVPFTNAFTWDQDKNLQVSLQPKPTPDNSPSVRLTSPVDGATVSGTVQICAEFSDDKELKKSEIWFGNAKSYDNLAGTQKTGCVGRDTTSRDSQGNLVFPDGRYTIQAYVWDSANQMTATASITVTVKNRPDCATEPIRVINYTEQFDEGFIGYIAYETCQATNSTYVEWHFGTSGTEEPAVLHDASSSWEFLAIVAPNRCDSTLIQFKIHAEIDGVDRSTDWYNMYVIPQGGGGFCPLSASALQETGTEDVSIIPIEFSLEGLGGIGLEIVKAFTIGSCIDEGIFTVYCALDVISLPSPTKLLKGVPAIAKGLDILTSSKKFIKGAQSIDNLLTLATKFRVHIQGTVAGVIDSAKLAALKDLGLVRLAAAGDSIGSSYPKLTEYAIKNADGTTAFNKLKNNGTDLAKLETVIAYYPPSHRVIADIMKLADIKGVNKVIDELESAIKTNNERQRIGPEFQLEKASNLRSEGVDVQEFSRLTTKSGTDLGTDVDVLVKTGDGFIVYETKNISWENLKPGFPQWDRLITDEPGGLYIKLPKLTQYDPGNTKIIVSFKKRGDEEQLAEVKKYLEGKRSAGMNVDYEVEP